MTQTLTVCVGLPASGKTTWTETQIRSKPYAPKRVSRDHIRRMLFGPLYQRPKAKAEELVTVVQNNIVETLLEQGRSVIIDDTNLRPDVQAKWRDMANRYGVDLHVEDFTNVPLDVCMQRDEARHDSVGRAVIQRMYDNYLRPPPIEQDTSLPSAIIVDVDGTLALNTSGRSPYATGVELLDDEVNEQVADYVRSKVHGNHIIVVTARQDRPDMGNLFTRWWLTNNQIPFDYLFSRKPDDQRKDAVVKREIFDEYIAGKFNVTLVLDDRTQVVNMWRELGLTCWQVAEGNF